MKKIILASASPRRKALLEQIGLKFSVSPSNHDEKMNARLKPRGQVEYLSLEKAKVVAQKYNDAIIIAADTLVVLNDQILGKPKNEKDAKRMLRTLSATVHSIITGFTIIDSSTKKTITKSEETKIFMKKISGKEIENYIKTKEPLDKAGAYSIQELGAIFIEKVEGDFFNAVGLPLFSLTNELKHFGISVL